MMMRKNRNTLKGTGIFLRLRGACPSAQRGVTLLELIIAVFILTLVAIATSTMIIAQIQGMAASSDITTAGNAARLVMEKLSNTPYAAITDGGSAVVGYYTVNWGVAETGAGAIVQKDITVAAKRTGTTPVLATLYTTIYNGVTYSP
jgi:prepilin-type N-terminal cleavage/methylation domain-containing protein